MTLEEQLADSDFRFLIRHLGAELTLITSKGSFALFHPRQCLRIEDRRLVLGHPCEQGISFTRNEILGVTGGVSILPYAGPGHRLFQRVLPDL